MYTNIITLTDSYKMVHWQQYPKGTEGVYSYFESREGAKFPETVFFGLQALVKEHLLGSVVSRTGIEDAEELARHHFGTDTYFNRKGWEYLLNVHGGRLPVRIRAVPEGTVVPTSHVLMTVENTDPQAYWLTNHLETLLSHVWASSTVATISLEAKRLFCQLLDETAETDLGLPFMLHDFGFRGVSSVASAGLEGAGHLLHFLGTDTLQAMEAAREYYHADPTTLAFSVAATEHSVMTACGPEGEADLLDSLLTKYPTGILSVVGDSYDIEVFARDLVGGRFRERILARDGVFVLRPDSGDPVVVSGRVLDILEECVGCTVNAKGFKVLPPQMRMLWGDGLELEMIRDFLDAAKVKGWSAENFVFGMGGGLLQKINRDTQCFAMKSSAQRRNGVWYDIRKTPKGGQDKISKAGKLGLERGADGTWTTFRLAENGHNDLLETVFEDGRLVQDQTFEQIRERVAQYVQPPMR